MSDTTVRVNGLHLEDWKMDSEGVFLDMALDDCGQALHLAEQLTQKLGLPCSVHPLEGPGQKTYTVKCASLQHPLLVNPLLSHVAPDTSADTVMEQEIGVFVQQGVADGTYASVEEGRAALFAAMRDLLVESMVPDPSLTA